MKIYIKPKKLAEIEFVVKGGVKMREKLKTFFSSKRLLGATLKEDLFKKLIITFFIATVVYIPISIIVDRNLAAIIVQIILIIFYSALYILQKKIKSITGQPALYIALCIIQNSRLFPLSYLLGGGIDSGFPIIFIAGGLTTILLLDNIVLLFVILINTISFACAYLIEWFRPDIVNSFTTMGTNTYLDIGFSSIFAGIGIGFFLRILAKNFDENQEKAKELLEQIEDASTKDPLTGAYNRRYLIDYIEKCITQIESDEIKAFSILMFDLDHFKKINDTYGHLAGDDCIKNLTYILKNSLRKVDVVARYGGEEFICVLPSAEDTPAFRRAEQIRATIENTQLSEKIKKTITVSGGVAMYKPGMTVDQLIEEADANLYIAKEKGRNQIVWHNGGIPPLCYVAYDPDNLKPVQNYGRRFSDMTKI